MCDGPLSELRSPVREAYASRESRASGAHPNASGEVPGLIVALAANLPLFGYEAMMRNAYFETGIIGNEWILDSLSFVPPASYKGHSGYSSMRGSRYSAHYRGAREGGLAPSRIEDHPSEHKGATMTSFGLRSAFLAAIGIAALTLPASALNSTTLDTSVSPLKSAAARLAVTPNECFTDEGYGRKRSCSAGLYKKNKKKEVKPVK
jgi:hypothetical protein